MKATAILPSGQGVWFDVPDEFDFSAWRHGGWYVHDVRYVSGACGCVSRNYADRKWRVVCAQSAHETTYANRTAAAQAEFIIAERERLACAENLFTFMAVA